MMKKIRMFLILLLTAALAFPAAFADDGSTGADTDSASSLDMKSFPFYTEGSGAEPFAAAFPLYFADGVDDLPYVDIRSVLTILNAAVGTDIFNGAELTGDFDPEDETVTIRLGSGDSVLWFDFAGQRAAYSQFETYCKNRDDAMLDSLSATGYSAETGAPELFERVPAGMFQREGDALRINLKDYDIPMIHRDDLFLLPMHTAFDLIFCLPSGGFVVCFNGQAVFFGSQAMLGRDTELGMMYYGVQVPERSPQLAAYGMNELCKELDHFYGLKEAHGISSFLNLIAYSGLAEQLLAPNANEADKGLALLLNYCLDDGHSAFRGNSWMTGTDPEDDPETVGEGFCGATWTASAQKMSTAKKQYPDCKKPYFEVGSTAYIYLKEFGYDNSNPGGYYDGISEEGLAADTVALIIYVHSQICRENSPIENVVLDLSTNIGGDADAAIFTMCWFLGEAPFSSVSPLTGAQRTALYRADVNLNHEFDERDTVGDKNLYCLVSPVSFSCGNLVPAVFKSSGQVTLIGDTTGGGSCVVLPMSSAWGSLYQISGPVRISFVKNGSFYDADRGVDPDVYLTKAETYYDREKLTELINGLQ